MSSSQSTGSIFSTNSGADASVFEVLHPDLLGLVKSKLQQSAVSTDLFAQVFGDKANTVELQTVRSQWSVGDFTNLPSVKILSAANTNGAVGAYVNQTVYLSDALFQPNAAPTSSVFGAAGVLVEETFHFLDSLVGSDTEGDEGEYAKDLIFGVSLSDSELNRVKSEDDRGFITVADQQVLAELAFDYAGNTLGTARAVTVSSSTTTFRDWVGRTDTNDYYRFSLGFTSNLNLSLTGLTADADVQLLNSAGTVIRSSTAGGSSSEFITQQLAAGTYYVRVYPYSSNSTYYNLGLSAIPVVPIDRAGNTLSTAANITLGASTTTFQDWVGSADTNDYYRFSVANTSNLNLSLNGLSADADVQLLNASGGLIQSSANSGTSAESIIRQVNAGTYYIRVFPYSSSSTYYNLNASATTVVPTNGFNSVYGYGLINAAAAVARAIGQSTPFADVPNLGGNNWGNDLVNAPEAWARGYTGQGVTVAVIDDGVDILHQDLSNNIWRNTREIAGNGIDDDRNGYVDDIHGWNFTTGFGGNSGNVRPESALSTHGTHVAGTIAASNNGIGVTGVAYNSRIMALKIANTNSNDDWINTGNLAQAIRYAVDNGARVINMSLGWSDSTALRDALAYAASRNVITVSAAGNSRGSSPGTPAHYATQYGFSVGAVNSSRTIASFSNLAGTNSSMQHVMAPGVNVYSTLPGNRYASYNGTSMAAPHVAGVVALMLGANPNLTHAQVRSILTSSATRLSQSSSSLGVSTVTGRNIHQGIGISVTSNLPDSNSLNNFASLDYQTVTSVANPSTTNLTTPSQNVGLIQTTVSNVVSTESTRKPVSTPKPLNVARSVFDLKILDSSLVNQSDWVLGTI